MAKITAHELAKKQKEISVAEFFERNKHILGFGNQTRALITSVKEAVDNSLTKDMPIIIEEDGITSIIKIGEFIDNKMKVTKPEILKNGSLQRLEISGIKTLCFNKNNFKLEFKNISTIFRHKVNSKIYRITLVGNRHVDLTDYHSVFGFRNGQIKSLKTSELEIGDTLVVPNSDWKIPILEEINLLQELLKLKPHETKKIGIYGIKKILPILKDEILNILPDGKKYRINDFKKCNRIPLNILRKINIDHKLFDNCKIDFMFGKSKVPIKIYITEELAEFFGLYVAEGSISGDHKINLSFGSHEKELINYVKNLFKKVWNLNASVLKAHKTATNVTANSTILAFILKNIFLVGSKANEKRIPKYVFNFPSTYKERFILAYSAGDGYPSEEIFLHMKKKKSINEIGIERIILATASKSLLSDIYYLLSSIGIDCTIETKKPRLGIINGKKTTFSECYIIYVYTNQIISEINKLPLNNIVECISDSKLLYNINNERQTQITLSHTSRLIDYHKISLTDVGKKLVDGEIGLLKIIKKEEIEYEGKWVYDFSVPGEENFMGGIGPIACHNSLDACEEAHILPDLNVEIKNHEDGECKVIVEDNGPGVVKKQIPHIFGRLLYGSRFHAIRQSRGQQGIGISAVVLYGQLTTGKHAKITSKVEEDRPAVVNELAIDTNKNRAEVISRDTVHWDKPTGTNVEISIMADYKRGKKYVYEYLQSTSIVNPHAQITYKEPDGTVHVFERTSDVLPRRSVEIKPHPYGVELGTLIKMAKHTKARQLNSFLKTEFSSMGDRTTNAAIEKAGLEKNLNPKSMTREQFLALHKAFKKVKIMAPSTDCISPIGETLIKRSLKHETQEISPEFIITASRPPSVYSGNPFQIEAGLVYGGSLPKEEPVKLLRFANRVPLLYQQGGCVSSSAISSIDWRRYGLSQPAGKGIPSGPAIFLTHVSSTLIPFTSESKEAIADVDEIENEIKLAFRECARKVQHHIHKKVRRAKTREKFDLISRILPEIAKKSAHMLDKPVPALEPIITKIMDVVWIEDLIEYEQVNRAPVQTTLIEGQPSEEEKSGIITKSKILVVNYKRSPQKFNLYAVIPEDAVVGTVTPKPAKIASNYIKWNLGTIPPVNKVDVVFELAGLEKGDFDENDLYIENINPSFVIGADKWEGE